MALRLQPVNSILTALAFLSIIPRSSAQPPHSALTLKDALGLTVKNSSMVLQAEQAVYGAEAKASESRSPLYPQMNVQSSYARLGPISSFSLDIPPMPPVTMKFGNENSYNVGISLQHSLFNWGRTQTGIEMGELGVRISETALATTQTAAAYQVIQAFYGILLSHESLRVFDQTIQALQTRKAMMKRRYESGLMSNFDLLTMDVQIAGIEGRKLEIETSLRKLEILFNKLTGRPLDMPVALAGQIEEQSYAFNTDSLLHAALESRGELRQAALQEDLARRQADMARTADKPNIAVNASYLLRNGLFPNLDALRGTWNASIVLAYPAFDGFRTSAQVDQAEVNVRVTELRRAELEQSVAMDVRQAIVDLQSNKQRIQIEKVRLEQAKEALEIATERHAGGFLSTIDLLDSQMSYQNAHLGYLQAITNHILAKYAIDRVTGKKFL
ncbi:MAG: hypothetical protein COS95_07490 [Ignavibacteriales bacterium CG07_land_8_20_14_0_80_59_12]|nr:MAG: hypothetical protein COS95_07490 [Ignavibacteriales bacterium CG07_land_8_20_14_0_80_59_12]